ncbi:hypothetical protein MRB53_039264 [Persea americana]|nr:hypothetical protein MRB53_039264 [Persea americana]
MRQHGRAQSRWSAESVRLVAYSYEALGDGTLGHDEIVQDLPQRRRASALRDRKRDCAKICLDPSSLVTPMTSIPLCRLERT